MNLTFYSNYLNHHQIGVADELHKRMGSDFRFVTTLPTLASELKGGCDYSSRPYCISAAKDDKEYEDAMCLARDSDVCVFGACSQEFAVERAKHGNNGISFELGERWLKKGWINIFSPTFLKWWINYILYFRNAPFYKLCCSGFAASDDRKFGAYKGRHYKWGYFTSVPEMGEEKYIEAPAGASMIKILWIARFLSLKHPELPLHMARKLKEKGRIFTLDYYGTGSEEDNIRQLSDKLDLDDVVAFHGAISNDRVYEVMLNSDIFLFTSDRNEGWGAVANESMSNACVLVASDAIGSSPYLIKDGYNGLVFQSGDADSLTEKVEWLFANPKEISRIKRNAYDTMHKLWNPSNAAKSLLKLIDDLRNGRGTSIKEGPCSKA